MPRMKILNSIEQEAFELPPLLNSAERKRHFDFPVAVGGIDKGHQTDSGFSAQRTTHSATGWICNAVGLKLQGAPARHENEGEPERMTFAARADSIGRTY